MNKRIFGCLLGMSLLAGSLGLLAFGPAVFPSNVQAAAPGVTVPAGTVPEARDFAREKFGDAWDMSEFSDISQYLNGAGRHPSLTNINVSAGVFSATSIGSRYNAPLAEFYPLHTGYPDIMQVGGNLGSLEPIDPAIYQCVFLAARVESNYPSQELPDGFRVLWLNDQQSGGINQVYFYPETIGGKEPIVHNWRLYQVDLRNPPQSGTHGTPWTAGVWTGLKLNPTLYKNIDFAIDWLRFSPCAENAAFKAKITWQPSNTISGIWVNPVGTNRNILVAAKNLAGIQSGVSGEQGSFTLDTRGLAPGSYRVGVGTIHTCCSEWSDGELTINQAPVAEFVRPSSYSGVDYASAGGNPWDMDASDFTAIHCTQYSFANGLLIFETGYPAILPNGCKGGELDEADPKLFLNLPAPLLVAGEYRYLSFRMFMDGPYSMVADGTIGRWMWTNTNNCTRVSADIPLDVGWRTYTIDLYDPLNGTPEEADQCDLKPWREMGQVTKLRFDPNENWTGPEVPERVFHQELDWMRLTKIDEVKRGNTFPIQIVLNKPVSEIDSIQYYYTTNPDNPTQNPAAGTETSAAAEPLRVSAGGKRLFLPYLGRNPVQAPPGGLTYYWKTGSVPPGEYYICAQVDDGFNKTTSCSRAPLKVTP